MPAGETPAPQGRFTKGRGPVPAADRPAGRGGGPLPAPGLLPRGGDAVKGGPASELLSGTRASPLPPRGRREPPPLRWWMSPGGGLLPFGVLSRTASANARPRTLGAMGSGCLESVVRRNRNLRGARNPRTRIGCLAPSATARSHAAAASAPRAPRSSAHRPAPCPRRSPCASLLAQRRLRQIQILCHLRDAAIARLAKPYGLAPELPRDRSPLALPHGSPLALSLALPGVHRHGEVQSTSTPLASPREGPEGSRGSSISKPPPPSGGH